MVRVLFTQHLVQLAVEVAGCRHAEAHGQERQHLVLLLHNELPLVRARVRLLGTGQKQ